MIGIDEARFNVEISFEGPYDHNTIGHRIVTAARARGAFAGAFQKLNQGPEIARRGVHGSTRHYAKPPPPRLTLCGDVRAGAQPAGLVASLFVTAPEIQGVDI